MGDRPFCAKVVSKGYFWNSKKYYQFYFAEDDHFDLIEKVFFDSLTDEQRVWLVKRKGVDAFQRYCLKQSKYE